MGRPSAVSFHTACCVSTPSPHPPEEESSPPAKRTSGTPPASETFKPYGTGRYGAGSVVIRRPPSETRFPKIIPAASGRHDFLNAPHAGAQGTAYHSSRQRSPHNEKPCRTLPDDTERPVHGFGRIGTASRPRRIDSLRAISQGKTAQRTFHGSSDTAHGGKRNDSRRRRWRRQAQVAMMIKTPANGLRSVRCRSCPAGRSPAPKETQRAVPGSGRSVAHGGMFRFAHKKSAPMRTSRR